MKTRLISLGMALGLAAGYFAFAPEITAQGTRNAGFFATLKVGDMVEVARDTLQTEQGVILQPQYVVRTYDDPGMSRVMIARITEIGADFIAVEFKTGEPPNEVSLQMRYPVHAISAVCHVRDRRGSLTSDEPGKKDDTKGKKPSTKGLKK